MWTTANRPKYNRDKLRYPSDLTDAEWGHVKPLIPPAKHGGRKRKADVREVVNGIMYVLSTGCQWRYVPKASRFFHDVGLSNVPSPGSTGAGDWPRILKISHATPWHSCVLHQSGLCSESFVMHNQLLGPTKVVAQGIAPEVCYGSPSGKHVLAVRFTRLHPIRTSGALFSSRR